jgi:hypothetical protein
LAVQLKVILEVGAILVPQVVVVGQRLLQHLLLAEGRLPEVQVVQVVLEVLVALQAAHLHKMAHMVVEHVLVAQVVQLEHVRQEMQILRG